MRNKVDLEAATKLAKRAVDFTTTEAMLESVKSPVDALMYASGMLDELRESEDLISEAQLLHVTDFMLNMSMRFGMGLHNAQILAGFPN